MGYVAALAEAHGAQALVFTFPARPLRNFGFMACTVSDDPETIVTARADERYNRRVADNYKMVLIPEDQDFAHEDFYISDFESLMRQSPDRYGVRVEFVGDTN